MSYATADNLNTRFGSTNITKWADLEGDASGVTARITAALAYADACIDQTLRGGGYAVPVQFQANTGTDVMLQDWACVIAGHWLYFSRGLLDEDKQQGKIEKLFEEVEKKLASVRAGKLRLDVRRWAPNPNSPGCLM